MRPKYNLNPKDQFTAATPGEPFDRRPYAFKLTTAQRDKLTAIDGHQAIVRDLIAKYLESLPE